MDDFERQLTEALRRVEAPAMLEAKIHAAVAREQPRPRVRIAWMQWAVVCLAMVVLVAGLGWEKARERAAGEAARAKLELALKVTSRTLGQIDRDIAAVGD